MRRCLVVSTHWRICAAHSQGQRVSKVRYSRIIREPCSCCGIRSMSTQMQRCVLIHDKSLQCSHPCVWRPYPDDAVLARFHLMIVHSTLLPTTYLDPLLTLYWFRVLQYNHDIGELITQGFFVGPPRDTGLNGVDTRSGWV